MRVSQKKLQVAIAEANEVLAELEGDATLTVRVPIVGRIIELDEGTDTLREMLVTRVQRNINFMQHVAMEQQQQGE